eukprot:UN13800
MRKAVVGSSIFVTISCWLRLVPCKKSDHIYWVYASMILNGVSSPVMLFTSPVLSSIWFPLSQRVTATSIALASGYIGFGLGSIIGPTIVRKNIHSTEHLHSQLLWLYFIEAAITTIICILIT